MKRKTQQQKPPASKQKAVPSAATLPVAEEPEYARKLREGEFIDPLSDVTRRERKSLLIVSFVALALTLGNLVPQEVSALGIKVSADDQQNLFLLLACAILYLMAAFIFYGHAEYQLWQAKLGSVERLRRKAASEISKRLIEERKETSQAGQSVGFDASQMGGIVLASQAMDDLKRSDRFIKSARRRLWFEYSVPLLTGVWALILLLEGTTGLQVLRGPSSLAVAHPYVATLIVVTLILGFLCWLGRKELVALRQRFTRWRERRHHKTFMERSAKLKTLPEGSREREDLQREQRESLKKTFERLGIPPERTSKLFDNKEVKRIPNSQADA